MPARLWDRRCLAQAALSITVGAAVALSVGAAKGELSGSAQPPANSVSQSHADARTTPQRG